MTDEMTEEETIQAAKNALATKIDDLAKRDPEVADIINALAKQIDDLSGALSHFRSRFMGEVHHKFIEAEELAAHHRQDWEASIRERFELVETRVGDHHDLLHPGA